MKNFYKNFDLTYLEKCIVKEEFNIHNPGIVKIYVPAIMPFISEGDPKEKSIRSNKSHLLNKDKSKIKTSSNCKTCNYIEVELPNYITAPLKDFDVEVESECSGGYAPADGGHCSPGTITNTVTITKSYFYDIDDNDNVSKNKEFILSFIGGDLNNRKIVGRYK